MFLHEAKQILRKLLLLRPRSLDNSNGLCTCASLNLLPDSTEQAHEPAAIQSLVAAYMRVSNLTPVTGSIQQPVQPWKVEPRNGCNICTFLIKQERAIIRKDVACRLINSEPFAKKRKKKKRATKWL